MTRTVIAALALALATAGCGGAGPTDPSRPPAGGAPSTGTNPYTGPALPGLSSTPLWSVHHEKAGIDPRWLLVGDTVVLARPDPTAAPAGRGSDPALLEFRAAATGRVTATVRTPADTLRVDEWDGRPVVVVSYQTAADRLTQVIAGYDASGQPRGEVRVEGEPDQVSVVGGRVFQRSGTAVTVRPVAGGRAIPLACAAPMCGYELRAGGIPTLRAGATVLPASVGNLLFTLEAGTEPGELRLVALDAATGGRRWDAASVAVPPGAAAPRSGLRVHPVAMAGGRLLLSWQAGAGDGPELAALHDPATGRLVTTGPTLPGPVNTILTEPAGKLAVASATGSSSDAGSAGWDLETGRITWDQAGDDKLLLAESLVNGIVYARTASGRASGNLDDFYTAVRLASKDVVAAEVRLASAPLGASSGHGILLYGDTLYAFGPS